MVLKTSLYSIEASDEAIQYGDHSSAEDHKGFLCNELSDMVKADQWLVFPYSTVHHATNQQVSPLGIAPLQDH